MLLESSAEDHWKPKSWLLCFCTVFSTDEKDVAHATLVEHNEWRGLTHTAASSPTRVKKEDWSREAGLRVTLEDAKQAGH